jgi:hypothetical protein
MRALEIIWEIFFLLFFRFFCVERPDVDPVCLDGIFGCPDDAVDSSGRSFFLSGRACFYNLYMALRPDVT